MKQTIEFAGWQEMESNNGTSVDRHDKSCSALTVPRIQPYEPAPGGAPKQHPLRGRNRQSPILGPQ